MLPNYASQTQGSLHRIPTEYIYPLEKVIDSLSCLLSFCVPFALTFFWGWEVYILIQYVYTSIYFEYRGSPSELRLESSSCRQRHGQPVLCAALKHRNFGLAFCILSIHSSVSRRGDLEGGVEHAASIFDYCVRVFRLSLIQCPPCPALLAFRLAPLSQHPSTAVCRLHLGSLIVGHPLLPP